MANYTNYLKRAAAQRLGTDVVYHEQEVDFSEQNLNVADTADVLNLPKGALILQAGFYTKTAQAGVTVALGVVTAAISLLGATAIGAALNQVQAALTTGKKLDANDTLRATIGGANATTAKVVFYAVYVVSDAGRN